MTVNAGAFAKLQLLLPGETAAPGSGDAARPARRRAQTAGTSFTVTVNAVDANWNVVTTVTDTVAITLDATPNATLPANAALVAGTKTFSVTLKTVGQPDGHGDRRRPTGRRPPTRARRRPSTPARSRSCRS